jgi:hypothetical protein
MGAPTFPKRLVRIDHALTQLELPRRVPSDGDKDAPEMYGSRQINKRDGCLLLLVNPQFMASAGPQCRLTH